MEYADIMQAIGSVGFPIVACGALFWMINTSMKELTGVIEKLNSSITLMNERMNRSDS